MKKAACIGRNGGNCFAFILMLFSVLPLSGQVSTQPQFAELSRSARNGNAKDIQRVNELANSGDTRAQMLLGVMYLIGEGVTKDSSVAIQWLQLCDFGAAPDSGAAFLLGDIYQEGNGVPKDMKTAIFWYRRAAELGDIHSLSWLGQIYMFGDGVPKDAGAGLIYLQRGAIQGDRDSMSLLGLLYESGDGTPKDLVTAYMWFNLGAARGSESAKQSRDSVEKRMTLDQVAEAQKLSREWKPKTVAKP